MDDRGLVIDGYDTDKEHAIVDESAGKTIDVILKHKKSVREKLLFLSEELRKRAEEHDNSKLQFPEIEWLIEMDKEQRYQYGTKEYFDKMNRWKKFFIHHYTQNRHHPDHFSNGIDDMNLVDITEFLVDIVSYYEVLQVHDGEKVLDDQEKRFQINGQLRNVLSNTLNDYFSNVGEYESIFEKNQKKN